MLSNRLERPMTRVAIQAIIAALLTFVAVPAVAAEVTVMVRGEFLDDETWNDAISIFESKTGIEVKAIAFAEWTELVERLVTMAAGGVSPDAVYHDNGAQGELVYRGVMAPIDEFVARDDLDLSIWPEPLMDAYRWDGHLYSLPTGVSPFALYYNADTMSAAGLADLPDAWDAPSFSFDDMADIAAKLTIDENGDGAPEQFGIQDVYQWGVRATPLWELHWINDEQTRFLGNSREHIEALEKIKSLYDRNLVGGAFVNQTAALWPNQAWVLNVLKGAMEGGGLSGWRIAVNPKGTCRCSTTGFHSWGIAEGAKNKEGAWEFIKFITMDPEGALRFARSENRVPVLPESIADFEQRWEDVNPGMRAHVLTQAINYVWTENFDGLPGTVWSTLYNMVRNSMRGQISPANAMAQVEPAINALLETVHRD